MMSPAMRHFIFRDSSPGGRKLKIKAYTLESARRKLGKYHIPEGREWLFIRSEK